MRKPVDGRVTFSYLHTKKYQAPQDFVTLNFFIHANKTSYIWKVDIFMAD